MEAGVLVAGEQVHQSARHTGQALEVAQAGRVDVDAAQAFPLGLDVADPRGGVVEAPGAAAQAAAHMEVLQDSREHHAAVSLLESLKMSRWRAHSALPRGGALTLQRQVLLTCLGISPFSQ